MLDFGHSYSFLQRTFCDSVSGEPSDGVAWCLSLARGLKPWKGECLFLALCALLKTLQKVDRKVGEIDSGPRPISYDSRPYSPRIASLPISLAVAGPPWKQEPSEFPCVFPLVLSTLSTQVSYFVYQCYRPRTNHNPP